MTAESTAVLARLREHIEAGHGCAGCDPAMCRIAVDAGLPVTLVEHGHDGCWSRGLMREDFV